MNEAAPSDGGCVVTAIDDDGNVTMDCGQVFTGEAINYTFSTTVTDTEDDDDTGTV